MSTPNRFWFHCGRCGSLFQSVAGEVEGRRCPECGDPPSLKGLAVAAGEVTPAPLPALRPAQTAASPGRSKSRRDKKQGPRYLMLQLAAVWLLVLGLVVLGARHYWPDASEDKARPPAATRVTAANPGAPAMTNENLILFNEASQKCVETISGFLASGTPEARNQFVFSPVDTAARMARYYSLNPLTVVDPKTLQLTARSVIDLPGGKALESYWSSQDGQNIEAVFRNEHGEWLLDWDHFARYGDTPWALFLAGSGAPEGEFRLLARERLTDARKKAESLSMVLYAPRFARPGETGFQSPEFLVPRKSPDGQRLETAFQWARSGRQVFGSQLPNLNPDGMIRVRVRVCRADVDGERKFEITTVLACHWYSTDDPGVPVAEVKAETP